MTCCEQGDSDVVPQLRGIRTAGSGDDEDVSCGATGLTRLSGFASLAAPGKCMLAGLTNTTPMKTKIHSISIHFRLNSIHNNLVLHRVRIR
jgi:hypothetical protein